MSKLTEILNLFCYDPEKDGANTFNIPKALNENWEKIDQLVLLAVAAAAAYDPEGSYAVGDYCTHGGKLHKCNTAIPSGEAWNAAHWTATTVAAELSKKSNGLVGNVQSLGYTKIADITENGTYLILGGPSYLSDYPKELSNDGLDYGVLRVTNGGSYTTYDIIAANASATKTGFAFGFLLEPGIAWERVEDTTSPEAHNLILASGVTNIDGYQSVYFKTQENIVTVILQCEGTFADNQHTASLPVDCYPKRNMTIPCIDGYTRTVGFLLVNIDGTIRVSFGESEKTSAISVFSFDAAEVSK